MSDTATTDTAAERTTGVMLTDAAAAKAAGLLRAEVGVGFNGYDVALYTELEDRAALAVYADHPAHCKVKEFVHSVICERVCCDYEV